MNKVQARKPSGRRAQRGMTFLGMLFLAVVGGSVMIVGAQVFPTYVEYRAILKAAKKASEGATVAQVREIFQRASEVDDFTSVKPNDLEITKKGDQVVVSFAYQREIPLVGPAYLVMKYQGSSEK
ncbi:DUF4845 domain-containing protein [Tibeticola sp.]|uniref:DUF4845 domain-containing protein n=1 Tax=Tibeticola sp. TaxID=2005368 RepID=UPI002600C4FC|nr:DUF4845 domain-containing protein [Tibeticola sp.]